jgi:uncharacterized membrane protein
MGTVSITLTTDALTLNGIAIQAGTYTISATAATLGGSGPSTSASFAGSATVNVTSGAVDLGPGSAGVSVGGSPIDPTNVLALAGYSGSIAISAGGNGTDTAAFNGTTAKVLQVSANQTSLSTNQNTPVTFQASVQTSFADSYTLTAEAPPGWTVSVDGTGNVTATPAPGLQAGTCSILIVAQSTTDAALVAQTTVSIAVTPTQPGLSLSVVTDPLFSVPFFSAELPTACRVEVHNNGPATDTYSLSVSNLPAGFALFQSATSVTVPAGQTGIVGIYLQPLAQVPAAGTQATFTVTATSVTDTSLTQSQDVTFTVPLIDALVATVDTPTVSASPGGSVSENVELNAVGNVTETVSLNAVLPSGVSATGLTSVTVAAGTTVAQPITVSFDASTPPNSMFLATITATYGPAAAPLTATTDVTLVVRSPQVVAVQQAATAANLLPDSRLGATLTDLATALAQLQTTPTDPTLLGQVQFLLGNVNLLIQADPALTSFVSQLQPIQAAANAGDIATLLSLASPFFTNLAPVLTQESREEFTVGLSPTEVELQPGQGKDFSVQLTNTGSDPVSLTLSTGTLPSGVTASFGQTEVTLAAGATTTVPLTLSQTLVSSKVFTLDVTAAASVAQQTATAVVAVRPATADVLDVTLGSTTVQAGTSVSVSAQVFNTANASRTVLAQVQVLDATGTVVSTLPDTSVTLVPGTDTTTLNLGSVDTTGLAAGVYSVKVSLLASDGSPLPGQSSQTPFLVGLPITASVSASATNLPPGTSTVTTTITVADPPPSTAGAPSAPAQPAGNATPVVDDQLQWIGGASGSWDTAANWLDITNNTHHVPTATDAVTIDIPGGATVASTSTDKALSIQVAAGNTLVLNRASLTLGSGTSEVDGTLTVNSSTLTLGGALTVTGTTQFLNDTGNVFISLDGNTLTNRGTLTVGGSGNADVRIVADTGSLGGTLLNEGTITQLGLVQLTLDDAVVLNNTTQGTYELTGDSTIAYVGGNLPTFVNAGVLHKSGGTGTSRLFNNLGFENSGTIEVDTGTLTLDTSGTSTSGTFTIAAGATLDLTGGSLGNFFTGAYTGSGGGTVALTQGALSIGAGGATLNFPAGMFQWTGGALNLQGNTLTNAGTLTVGSATSSTVEELETRNGNGFNPPPLPGGTLLNTGTILQQGAGTLNLFDTIVLNNQSVYQITGDGSISNNGSLPTTFANAAMLVKTGGSGTSQVTPILNNTGTTEADSGMLALSPFTGYPSSDQISGDQLTGGTWVARDGGTLALSRTIHTNDGSLTIDGAGSTISGVQALAVNSGSVTVTNGANFSTTSSLDNKGTIVLGPAGTLSVAGSYTQEAAGTLDVQLGSAPAAEQFGALAVTKSMTAGGVLRAELVGGYTPTAGDSFTVVTSSGSSGQLDAVEMPATTTVAFGATVNPDTIVLTAQSATLTPTTTTVTSSLPSGATFGQQVTFTATVQAAGSSGAPTGMVQFQIDGLNVGSAMTLTNGIATLTTTLGVGQHSVTALFISDNTQFADSDDASNPLSQTVSPGTATTAPSAALYYTQFGSTGGVSSVTIGYDGSSLTIGTPTAVTTNAPGDGLIFLPNGNLLVGGERVTEINPTTGAVVGSVAVVGDHLALDPSATKVWTSDQGTGVAGQPGPLVEIDLPSLTAVTHNLHGDDSSVTHLAFTPDGTAFYTVSSPSGTGGFGLIDLSTFTTRRLVSNLQGAHGLSYDPYTGDLIMVGDASVVQFDPRTLQIVSTLNFPGSGFQLDQGAVDGHGHLYAADNNGHLIFVDYSATGLVGDARDFVSTPFLATTLDDFAPVSGLGAPGVALTVNHLLPASGYTIDPASINAGGTLASSGVLWNTQLPNGSTAPLSFQLTGQVTNMAPGEVRAISLGTTVTTTVTANGATFPVTLQLPPVLVSANHIISINPISQSVVRNGTITYNVALTDPLATDQTYTLSTDGLAGFTTGLASTVTVRAGQTVTTPLTITAPASAVPGMDGFTVFAQTASGGVDSVEGEVTVEPQVDLPAGAVMVQLQPVQATVGQGTSASYEVVITNLGDATDTYTLSDMVPAGVSASLAQQTTTVPAGLSNSRDVLLTLAAPVGTAVGSDQFSVTATSTTTPSVAATATGTVNVVGNGVSVALNPPSGAPGTTFQMTVTNTGQTTDTFDLAVAGPAGLVAQLATSKLTLAAGASQVVQITTRPVTFAVPGALTLTATATSETNPAVKVGATATLTVPTMTGLVASFNPGSQTVSIPGSGTFLLQVNNTGNTEDAYAATITRTTGPITANLMGLDGQPTQTIPVFRLPGLSNGALLLQTNQAGPGQGTVTVQVQSLNHADLTAAPTVVENAAVAPPPPIASSPAAAPASSSAASMGNFGILGLETNGFAAVGLVTLPRLELLDLMFAYFPALAGTTFELLATPGPNNTLEELFFNGMGEMFSAMLHITQANALQFSWMGLSPAFEVLLSAPGARGGVLSEQVVDGQGFQVLATPFLPLP